MDGVSDERAKCLDLLRDISEEKIDQLFGIWKSVGHANISSRANVVCSSVKQLLTDMVDEETEYQVSLAQKIQDLLKEASELCHDVGGNYNEMISGCEDSSVPLLEVDRLINERLQDVRACKEDRMKRYGSLLEKEHQLCSSMGLKKRTKISRIPREEDIDDLQSSVTHLCKEEKELKLQFTETKLRIENISSELGIDPETSFHKMLSEGAEICLSSQNMRLLKELHQRVEQKLEKAKSESIELREKLSNLWERLHVPTAERDVFLQQYPGYSKKSIDALKNEIKKCEERKRQNIRVFVETIREEISDWWDKCCFGKQQRQQFRAFYSDCYTEDLLELHELEVQRLKQYYFDNINILELAKKREKLWKEMMELDERAHDPNRLFKNRGGQLLREEKERKAIQKDLPLIDKELKTFLDGYERKMGVPFFFDGENLREIIQLKWDGFQKKKEEEKLARKKVKDSTLSERTLSATKRKFPSSNTPMPIPSKRATPASATQSIATGSGIHNVGSKVVRRMFNRPKTPTSTRKGIHSPEASYTHFEVNLDKHQGMGRSTVVPSRLLRERNGQGEGCNSAAKDRVATPAKPPRKNSTTRSCSNLAEFRTPQAPRQNHSPGMSRSRSASRLAALRGHLPIII